MHRRKIVAAVLLVVVAGALFLTLDLGRYLSLDYLKQSQSAFAALYARQPGSVAGAYFAVYLAATALSVPGAVVLTLAGGAIFGLGLGTVLVSFASSMGALLAFLVARFLLRDAVTARFGQRLAQINQGVERQGPTYLFTLRLVPLVPFFLINLALGLTRMKPWTFYWVSQLGMLAGTLVYVNAGTQLARIDSAGAILSPALIASFVLLGIFPWLAKRFMGLLERRKVFARWKSVRPRQFDRNMVVIGAGAAGLVSAYLAAAVKASVTLVERHKMGGDCLNYGCVPSKALIRSARLAHQMRTADRYGLSSSEPSFSFKAVMDRIQRVIRQIEPHDSVERFSSLGVDVVRGSARITSPWSVEITLDDGGRKTLTTRSIVIAAGASPVVPAIPGLEAVGYLTSDTVWESFAQLDAPPERLVILGGGPIGCELAQAFARLGSQVTQVEMAQRLIGREDDDVSALARAALEADGVRVLTGHQALRCEAGAGEKSLVVQADDSELRIPFDALICAVGRRARVTGYGLEELGLAISEQHTVDTNEYLQTLYPNIYAAGDVAGPFQFTHTAAHQAWYATVNALFGEFRSFKADDSVIPSATFIDPEVARVGLNERQAKQQGIPYEVTRYAMKELDRAIAEGDTEGFVKVLTVPGRDRILGVTIVGQHAGELLAEYVLAMKQRLGLGKILGSVHTYPTWSEANKYVAGEWRRAHQPKRLLEWARRYHAWKRG